MKRPKQMADEPEAPSTGQEWLSSGWLKCSIALIVLVAVAALMVDWWTCLPEGTTASYVGRQSCVDCHAQQEHAWQGSHHDLAMDHATADSVLGDFSDAEFKHFDITSRMFMRDDKYMVHTEGPTGEMEDFEVKYVFGVDPLQQYLVEFDRPDDMPADEVARLQTLRISWDTHKREWFYLPPPDVDDKLSPDDELHWTGVGQRWNTMCAACHSTNLQKNFDVDSMTYHTTFSEIDVSCEACHGPGSVHVELANQTSVFWDRKLGYGLARLKDKNSDIQIQTCARCHARQQVVSGQFQPGDDYYDHFNNTLLLPGIYHPDGQVLDEDYVFGSFIQSKMYHKDIRCTDCHDPHTTRVKHQGNQLCTSCHQHPEGKFDTFSHHRHKQGSTGSKCVECHMPETTYMELDARRDHSLRIPRPDLSVELGVPNACSRCHLDEAEIDPAKTEKFSQYADWLLAARGGDEEVKQALAKLDEKMNDAARQWYGEVPLADEHFAHVLAQAWAGEAESEEGLIQLSGDRRLAAMVRASAVTQLGRFGSIETLKAARQALSDPDPQVRAAAVGTYDAYFPSFAVANLDELTLVKREAQPLVEDLTPLLGDPVRLVRTETAMALSRVPPMVQSQLLSNSQRRQMKEAMQELEQRLMLNNDRGRAHATLGSLYEGRGEDQAAINTYRVAIRVEPQMLGTRRNLAAVLDRITRYEDQRFQQGYRQAKLAELQNASTPEQIQFWKEEMERVAKLVGENTEESSRLRLEELALLERRARLLPNNAESQYEVGLFLDLHGRSDEALIALAKASQLEPNMPQFLLGLTYFHQKYRHWEEAIQGAQKLIALRPEEQEFQDLLVEIQREAAANPIGPQRPNQ